MAADCILHVEHHEFSDECLRAAISWCVGQVPRPEFSLFEAYQQTYEGLAALQLTVRSGWRGPRATSSVQNDGAPDPL